MKNTFAFEKWNRSILAAALMFAVAGTVQAQSSTAGEGGGSTSGQGATKTGKSAPGGKTSTAAQRKGQGGSSAEPGGYAYGKDAARDYAISQGAGPSGQASYTYGKDAASDYARSQGQDISTGRGPAGTGSSSSQSD